MTPFFEIRDDGHVVFPEEALRRLHDNPGAAFGRGEFLAVAAFLRVLPGKTVNGAEFICLSDCGLMFGEGGEEVPGGVLAFCNQTQRYTLVNLEAFEASNEIGEPVRETVRG